MAKTIQAGYHPMQDWTHKFIPFLRVILCTMILAVIIALMMFIANEILDIYRSIFQREPRNFLHDIALLLVEIKAFRILVSYLLTYHVSVKYIVEISIIASAVEIIFAADRHSIEINVLYGVFCIAMLIVYVMFREKLVSAEQAG